MLLSNLKYLFGYEIDYNESNDWMTDQSKGVIRQCCIYDINIVFRMFWYYHVETGYYFDEDTYLTQYHYSAWRYDENSTANSGIVFFVNLCCDSDRQLIYQQKLNENYNCKYVNQELYNELLKTILQANPFESIIKQDMLKLKNDYIFRSGL